MLDLAAHELAQLFVNDFDDHLGGRQGFQYIGSDAAFRNSFGKILYNLVADICLQQSHSDLPHGLLHIRFLQPAFTAKLFEGGRNFFS